MAQLVLKSRSLAIFSEKVTNTCITCVVATTTMAQPTLKSPILAIFLTMWLEQICVSWQCTTYVVATKTTTTQPLLKSHYFTGYFQWRQWSDTNIFFCDTSKAFSVYELWVLHDVLLHILCWSYTVRWDLFEETAQYHVCAQQSCVDCLQLETPSVELLNLLPLLLQRLLCVSPLLTHLL